MKNFILFFIFSSYSLFIISCGSGDSSKYSQGDSQSEDFINPVYKTKDGSEFFLLSDKETIDAIKDREEILSYEIQKKNIQSQNIQKKALPQKVFLKEFQTSIKNQEQRNTCTSFAFASALESKYKRDYGLDLDLSEQYINHIQKIQYLRSNVNLPVSETMLGTWAGAGVSWVALILNYGSGVPDDNYYIKDNCYEKTDEETDSPKYTYSNYLDNRYTQKAFDDFNLFQSDIVDSQRLDFPSSFGFLCTTAILDFFKGSNAYNSKYGISSKTIATDSQLVNLDWYKQQLAEGKEIIFGVSLYPDRFESGVWKPDEPYDDRTGGHVMVIVGYDDTKRAFIVKNSWGRQTIKDSDGNVLLDENGNPVKKGRPIAADEDGDGFILMGYEWVEEGLFWDAVVINTVTSPDFYNDRYIVPAAILGRWEIHMESKSTEPDTNPNGFLDIYHFPGTMSFRYVDSRLGTYFDINGNSYRVNGRYSNPSLRNFDRNEGLTFYFNPDRPNIHPSDSQQGRVFNGYISENKKWIAGYYTDELDNLKYGFLAFKKPFPSFKYNNISHPLHSSDNTYLGLWLLKDSAGELDIVLDNTAQNGGEKEYLGSRVIFEYEFVDSNYTGDFSFYTEYSNIIKTFSSQPNKVEITVIKRKLNTSGGYTEETNVYTGYLFKNNPYRISGYYLKDGIKHPFYAERYKNPPLTLKIKSPSNLVNTVYQRNLHLEAQITNQEFDPVPASKKVIWTYKGRKVGEGLSIDVVLPYSEYDLIEVCLTDRENCLFETDKFSYDKILLKVQNFPPTVEITSPNNNETFCTGQDINFRASVSDANGEEIDEDLIQWIFGNIGQKTGKSVVSKFLYPGRYNVSVSYIDEGGAVGDDTISVNIEECSNNTPVITITYPEQDTYLPSPTKIYNDGTQDITISVDYTATDEEDGNIPSDNISWMLYVPSINYTFVGNYSELDVCIDITPLGCGAYQTVKQVYFEKVPLCEDVYLKASVFDSDGNFSEDSVFLLKPADCNLQ